MTVMAVFFPVFFKEYWSNGATAAQSTFQLGAANSIASLVIVLLAPVLGAIADRGSAKKKFLLFFTFMGIVMTACLVLVARGDWMLAVGLYVLATIGFSGGVVFYDSLIVDVANDKNMDVISALGYALGYLGGGVLFSINVWMTQSPGTFGLEDASQAVRASFITVAIWWAVFSIPVFLFVKERRPLREKRHGSVVVAGFLQLAHTFREIRNLRTVFLFLIGYWLYIDGVDTIVRMAVDYGMALGFESGQLMIALLVTQFVGFPAAIMFGKLGQRIGPRAGIFIALFVYVGVCIWGYFMDQVAEFYVLAVVVGLVQGGVQSLSRSLYARLIPKDKAAEFFGFYNMLGKFAAVIGPVMMGWVGVITGNPRFSILSVIVLFLAGAAFLYFVDETEGRRRAQALASQI
jgi:UMF1 family MFS transporter